MLDLRYFRVPRFDAALVVAFAVYFGTFSIFFFTALYLQEVVGYTGYRTAVLFLPMARVDGPRRLARRPPDLASRRPMDDDGGCRIAAGGILASEPLIVVHPSFGPLALTLALAGLGIGAAIVPVTSTVLELVPAEHSGMAASTTNTARQLGVVFGVAVLGALVNAHLTTDLSSRLERLGIPAHVPVDRHQRGGARHRAERRRRARQRPVLRSDRQPRDQRGVRRVPQSV